jgi:hypothetical protein
MRPRPVTDPQPHPTTAPETDGTVMPGDGETGGASPDASPARPAAVPGGIVGQVVGQVVRAAIDQVVRVVRPEAAVAVATEFGFPLGLAGAVLVFLIVQGHVDRRDPKLRIAPQNAGETFVTFKGEDQL